LIHAGLGSQSPPVDHRQLNQEEKTMTTPKVGLAGQFVLHNQPSNPVPCQIKQVNGDGTVSVTVLTASPTSHNSIEFVDVGNQPAGSGDWFQAIDPVN
jgi:hypothetical protein